MTHAIMHQLNRRFFMKKKAEHKEENRTDQAGDSKSRRHADRITYQADAKLGQRVLAIELHSSRQRADWIC